MDNGISRNFFPKYLDRPRLIGVFEIDEFIIIFGVIFVVIALSLATPSLGSGTVMPVAFFSGISLGLAYRKFKKNRPNGYTMQILYKVGLFHPEDNVAKLVSHPYLKNLKCVPFGFTKELVS